MTLNEVKSNLIKTRLTILKMLALWTLMQFLYCLRASRYSLNVRVLIVTPGLEENYHGILKYCSFIFSLSYVSAYVAAMCADLMKQIPVW